MNETRTFANENIANPNIRKGTCIKLKKASVAIAFAGVNSLPKTSMYKVNVTTMIISGRIVVNTSYKFIYYYISYYLLLSPHGKDFMNK